MKTATVTPETVTRLERSETSAWIDMYAAAPDDYARHYKLGIEMIGDVVVLLCDTIPFFHFNCVMGLGLAEPATEEQLDQILGIFDDRGIDGYYIHLLPESRPEELAGWLTARGLRVRSGWERIHRDGAPLPEADREKAQEAERVTTSTASEWAGFVTGTYNLPTKPWLEALVGRAGWHHSILRSDAGSIVAARSMYVGPDGRAWLGIDTPVPGLMAPSYDLDTTITRALIADGLALGATSFLADIEAPSATMETPAYANFAAIGFQRLYMRTNYGR